MDKRRLARFVIRLLPPCVLAILGSRGLAWLIMHAGVGRAVLECLNR